jgi:stage II sporulation protein D
MTKPAPQVTLFGRDFSARVVLAVALVAGTLALFFTYRKVSALSSRPPRQGPLVRVLCAGPAPELRFAAQSAYTVQTLSGRTPLALGEPMEIVARQAEQSIQFNGADVGPGPVRLEAKEDDAFVVGRAPVATALIIARSTKGGIELIGELDMETYLARALFAEMPASFEREALKAQLVAARSYAYAYVLAGKTLFADDRSLMYPGKTEREAKARELCEETAGQVLLHDGVVVTAYFHSTCGGHTLPIERAFGGAPSPVFPGHECTYCQHSPRYRWDAPLEREHVACALRIEPDDLTGLRLDPETQRLIATTTAGEVALPFAQFRQRYHASAGREIMFSSRFLELRESGASLVLRGIGFGHGVGLCQYGADGLARSGLNYLDILRFYYPSTEVRTLW